MDRRRRNVRKPNNDRYSMQGNLAIKPMPKYAPAQSPKKLSDAARKNREKAAHMGPGYVLFLVAAFGFMLFECAHYLQIQSDVTGLSRNVTILESKVQDMVLSNDEEYARIMGAVDLEAIKKTAMEDLGMGYPDESQVVNYVDNDSDYVRQFGDIPD